MLASHPLPASCHERLLPVELEIDGHVVGLLLWLGEPVHGTITTLPVALRSAMRRRAAGASDSG